MNLRKTHILGLACFAAMLGIAASNAQAQVGTGKLNLPFEAKWGKADLKPGQYTIFLPLSTSNVQLIYIYGNGKTMQVMTSTTEVGRPYGRSFLHLVRVGDVYAVNQFDFGAAGKSFSFVTPKISKEAAAAASSQSTSIAIQ